MPKIGFALSGCFHYRISRLLGSGDGVSLHPYRGAHWISDATIEMAPA